MLNAKYSLGTPHWQQMLNTPLSHPSAFIAILLRTLGSNKIVVTCAIQELFGNCVKCIINHDSWILHPNVSTRIKFLFKKLFTNWSVWLGQTKELPPTDLTQRCRLRCYRMDDITIARKRNTKIYRVWLSRTKHSNNVWSEATNRRVRIWYQHQISVCRLLGSNKTRLIGTHSTSNLLAG